MKIYTHVRTRTLWFGIGLGICMTLLISTVMAAKGDIDNDGDVDRDDFGLLIEQRNSPASGPNDPLDLDGDGRITALDARKLMFLCDRPRCAVPRTLRPVAAPRKLKDKPD